MPERTTTQHRTTTAPPGFARRPLRTIRPADAAGDYAHPRQEFARLERRGALHRAATGYYIVVPQEHVGRPWLPNLEATAAGIAAAAYDADHAVIMGISAARIHGAIPRALATAVVAVPAQHEPIDLLDRPATIRFVKRDTDRLDAERAATELGAALVTTVEQTVLDLAHRPQLGDAEIEVPTAIATLYPRCDTNRLHDLAAHQRLRKALERAEHLAKAPR